MNPVRDPFARMVAALAPWLDQVVIVGGWAHRLYRLHPNAQELDYPPLTTLDADIALPPNLPVRDEDIRARLTSHGFAEELSGEFRPPATHYRLGGAVSGFYVEFLTPLTGSEFDRKGNRRATVAVSGIASQRLRHIGLLLHHPWTITLDTASIQIANPVSFIGQKILIHERRERADRAKDILYMHDTLEVFGARLEELNDLWKRLVVPELYKRDAAIVSQSGKVLFGKVTDDVRRAALISPERVLSPERIREACEYGFALIFR